MKYIVYISALAFMALGLTLATPGTVWTIGFFAFVMLGHAPALLRISTQKKLFAPHPKQGIFLPELVGAGALVLTWAIAIINGQVFGLSYGAGGAVIIAVICAYGAVRAVCIAVSKVRTLSQPLFMGATVGVPFHAGAQSMRVIYLLRVALTVVSTLCLLAPNTWNADMTIATFAIFASVFTLIIIIYLVFTSYHSIKAAYFDSKSLSLSRLETKIASIRPKLVVYYSSKEKKHPRLLLLIDELSGRNTPFIILCRESSTFDIISAHTPNAFFAPTINTLDAFITPSLKVAIYLNDAEKNGHFIRFNQLTHVLLVETPHVPDGIIPKNLAIYHNVVARDKAQFDCWEAAPENQSFNAKLGFIDEITRGRLLSLKVRAPAADESWVIGTTIHPPQNQVEWQRLQLWLDQLIKAVRDHKTPRLQLLLRFVATAGKGSVPNMMLDITKQRVERDASMQLLRHPDGRSQIEIVSSANYDCYNWADIIIGGPLDDLFALTDTQKPIVYSLPLATGSPDQKIASLSPDLHNFTSVITRITSGDSAPILHSALDQYSAQRFSSASDLVDALLAPSSVEGGQQ